MWASQSSIKENASSIKKFYKCMTELNYISQEAYDFLKKIIKENMKYWLKEMTKFDKLCYEDDINDFLN